MPVFIVPLLLLLLFILIFTIRIVKGVNVSVVDTDDNGNIGVD